MWDWFRNWYKEAATKKWTKQSYDPLFDVYDKLERHVINLTDVLRFFEDMQKDLREGDIKERWQAIKLDIIIEQYKTAIDKIEEALQNIPKRPDKPERFVIQFFDYNNDNDINYGI